MTSGWLAELAPIWWSLSLCVLTEGGAKVASRWGESEGVASRAEHQHKDGRHLRSWSGHAKFRKL